MTERYAQIFRLLDARYDGLPEPRRRSEIASGFVHGLDPKGQPWRWLSCPDCLANDRVMFGCETCGGRGRIPDLGRDPMAESKVVQYGADGSRHDAAYARDRQIEALRQQTRPAATVDEAEDAKANPYAWERERARLYATTDLAALFVALEQLASAHPGTNPYSELGLAFLSDRLPDPLRAPGAEPEKRVRGPVRPEAGPATLATRDAEMRAAAAEGASVKQLCARFGVSKSTVYAVVNKEAA